MPEFSLPDFLSWEGPRPTSIVSTGDGWWKVHWNLNPGESFAVGCELELPPSADPFWCIPGLFWGDNLLDSCPQYYPRFDALLEEPSRFRSSYWEFDVWRASQPLVAVHDGSGWVILEVAPAGHAGSASLKSGVGFAYRDGIPRLRASLPANERPYRPVGHDYTGPIKGTHFPAAAEICHWSLRVLRIPGERRELLSFLEEQYHIATALEFPANPTVHASVTRDALMKWHHDPARNSFRYTAAFDRIGQQIAEAGGTSLDRQEMGVGWVSGWVVFEALIEWAARHNDAAAIEAVSYCWSHLISVGLVSPSGFWWTRHVPPDALSASIFAGRLAGGFDGNWMPDPHHLHLRTLGDAVWRASRTLRHHRAILPFAKDLHPQLQVQAQKVADLAVEGWPLPMSVDARTGRPAGLQGTAAMIWISVWCELTRLGSGEFLELIHSGLDHYRSAVEEGLLFGAPEDVGESLTSEDTYIALNTYADAFRLLQRPEDLETCVKAAQQLYLWRKSFHHDFDPRTLIGVYGLSSRGGDIASFKNNHLHIYGLDADASLRDLAKWTGNDRWTRLADDHWAFASQLTPLVDGQFNAYAGMVTEQFYFIDWSGLGNSVIHLEKDDHRAGYDVGPFYSNHGNLAGFSHAWCTAMVLRVALEREGANGFESPCSPT